MAFIIFYFFFLKKFEKVEKTGFFRAKFLLHCTLSFILGFDNLFFSLQKSRSKLIFENYTGSKNQVRNRLKIQFVELDFSKLIFQKSITDQQGVSFLKPFKSSTDVGILKLCLFWNCFYRVIWNTTYQTVLIKWLIGATFVL